MQINFLSKSFNRIIKILLFISAFEGSIAAAILIQLPSDTTNNLIFHLSPARMIILGAILFMVGTCLFFALRLIQKPNLSSKIYIWITGRFYGLFVFSGIAISYLSFTFIAILNDLFRTTTIYIYYAYAQRLAPLFFYISLIGFQFVVYIVWFNGKRIKELISSESAFLKTWILTFCGLLLLTLLIALTRLGLNADPVGWGKPTVPLLEWQIWLAVLLSVSLRFFANSRLAVRFSEFRNQHPHLWGCSISVIIWLAAVLLWMSQPVPPGFFATPPRPPNFEIYPFSDAAFYDFHAQSLLIGLGFRGDAIPPRPLYILFLAVAHLIVGQDYNLVILVQTFGLAFFPVIIFWIGKKMSSQPIGLLAAFFVILREWTSILSTPFTSDISNSKLLFADLPAALVIALLLLVVILWLEKPCNLFYALLVGGVLGISLLVRTQIIILLPVILFFSILPLGKTKLITLVYPAVILLFGLIITIAPWLYRNYLITGQFVFDHPESQTRVMAQRFSPSTELTDLDRGSDETTGEYNQRLSVFIREQIKDKPLYVAQFMSAHWFNNLISNLLIFPIRFSITSPTELVIPQHAFWEEWSGNLTAGQLLIVFLNLAILTLGGVFLFFKNSWVGLMPLAFNAAYHFSNAAARNSGWRYLLPVDWVFLLYFSAGVYFLISFGIRKPFFKLSSQSSNEQVRINGWRKIAALSLSFLLVGATPLIAESAFPRIFPEVNQASTKMALSPSLAKITGEEKSRINDLLNDPNVKILQGRMLYPRFYENSEGEENTGKTGYAPMPYSRYVFLIAGDPEGTIIFPHNSPDLPLRNGEPTLVIGCMDGLAINALIVLPTPPSANLYFAEPSVYWTCNPRP